MTEQPAEHLARIKRQNPLWSIRHICEDFGWQATRDGYLNIWAAPPADLETRLREARLDVPRWWAPYAAEFPGWRGWCGVGETGYYARLPGSSPPLVVRAGDPASLAQRIRERREGTGG